MPKKSSRGDAEKKGFRAEGAEGAETAERRNEGGKAANLSFLGVSA
jgi:hypothetical protein